MIRKRIAVLAFVAGVLCAWAMQAPAQDSITPTEDLIAEAQNPTVEPIPPTFEVSEEDGRTILMTDIPDEDTSVTLSFESLVDGVRTHVDLDSNGLKYRYTLVPSKTATDTPIILELEGPVFKGDPGVRLKIRF
jgi:hypothetical protein